MPLVFAGCSKDSLDEINRDRNNPKDVQAKFILADVITRTAFSNSSGEINTYVSSYVEHEAGIYNQLYNAEMRISQPSLASTFNNPWGSLYTSLKDAKLVISKCSAGGSQEGNDFTKGIGEVMAAYNLALITDMFGDAPWLEAGDWTKTLTPKIDKQEVIYQDVMKYLDNAIVDLQKPDKHVSGSVGGHDLLFNGSASKWLKFAYGLKARYTMRLIKRSTNLNGDLQKVIDYANLSFADASEQAAFDKYDANNLNPTFDFQWSRDYLAASQSIVDKLVARNDPRLRRNFIGADWTQISDLSAPVDPDDPTGDTYGDLFAQNGNVTQVQYTYNTSMFMFSQTAPTLLLSYHEVLFLKAEAMQRLGNSVIAITPVLRNAVVAAIANSERSVKAGLTAPTVGDIPETSDPITPTEAGTYFTTRVLPLLTANPLKEIMNQKYLAFFGASGESTETYNDIRRMKALGENLVELKNPKPFPLRLPYGNDDTTANPNVQAAYGDGQYVYSIPVWWAGGTR